MTRSEVQVPHRPPDKIHPERGGFLLDVAGRIGSMSYPFTKIAIIYNPNSTGDSKKNALKLERYLKDNLSSLVAVECDATKNAGHAEELARELASNTSKVLIISSSGDGGFNEVVNGVLASGNTEAAAIVLPSGNANDHHEATSLRSLEEKILKPKIESVDVIKVMATKDGKEFKRYAHSYVGIGLTAYIGKKLTEATLNSVNEKWLVLKYLLLFKSVVLRIDPDLRWHHYTSVVFGNINRMSKVLKLATESDYDDGKMELYELKTRSTFKTIVSLLIGSTFGLRAAAQLKQITLVARRPIEVQFDGEVVHLDGNTTITVSVVRNGLGTLQ